MSEAFFEYLRTRLAPGLREDGFRGSGRTFRRTAGEFLHVINIQGSQFGAKCCVNLGVHLSFLPAAGMSAIPDPRRITEAQCAFRKRLAPSGRSDHWWSYGGTESECEATAQDLINTYFTEGRAHFAKATAFPEPFSFVTVEQVAAGDLRSLPGGTSLVLACVVLARVAIYCGDPARANQFIALGLEHVGSAHGLRYELSELARGL